MIGARLAVWTVVAGLALGLATGAAGAHSAPTGKTLDLIVPGELVGPMSAIIPAFERKTGVKVTWTEQNMALLTDAALQRKAKPDVFLALGDVEMGRVAEAGLMSGSMMFAQNSMAIMTPKANLAGVKTIEDLASGKVKHVALPDPKANSSGKYAIQAMKRAGVWKAVEPKLMVTDLSHESKMAAATGKVEAAFNFYPCRFEVEKPGQPPREPKDLNVIELPQKLYQAFWCEAGVMKGAAHPAEGQEFVQFLVTPEAQQVLLRWGFGAANSAVCTGGVCPLGGGPGGPH